MLRPLLVLSALTAAPPAFALDCYVAETWLPHDGATDVPTNAVIRRSTADASDLGDARLFVAASGEPVPATVAVSPLAGGLESYVLTPDADLEPETTYAVAFAETLDDPSLAWRTFTTGTGADTDAPAAPVLVEAIRDSGRNEWGTWRFNVVTLEVSEPVAYGVEVADNDDFSDSRFVELGVRASTPGEDAIVEVGSGLCGGAIDLDRGDRHMNIVAIDMAGNVSEAVYVVATEGDNVLDYPHVDESGCGCSSTGGAPALGFSAALLLSILGLRRRKES